MSIESFSRHLRCCAMAVAEQQRWVESFATIGIQFILDALRRPLPQRLEISIPPDLRLDWSVGSVRRQAGVREDWIEGGGAPEQVYLHPLVATEEHWALVSRYIERAHLSDKQLGLLFPLLSRTRFPGRARGSGPATSQLLSEVQRLNKIIRANELAIRQFVDAGGNPARLQEYRTHITTHGRIGNIIGAIGSAGASMAVLEAVREVDRTCVRDVHGCELPRGIRSPAQIYSYVYEQDGRCLTTVLLRSGRAISFAANPDIAIYEKLGGRKYASAREAYDEWSEVRSDSAAREDKLKLHAFGEVKTATDRNNLTERMGLASRETKNEVHNKRFLMMSLLPEQFSEEQVEKAYNRFTDVFNLYFAWGYDTARADHPEHWNAFKEALAGWCALRRP